MKTANLHSFLLDLKNKTFYSIEVFNRLNADDQQAIPISD